MKLAAALLASSAALAGGDGSLCDLVLHEERLELDEAVLQTTLARSRVEAFAEVVELYRGLWNAKAIDRMSYLRAEYDYDSAKLAMERADLTLARQRALIDHVGAICAEGEETSSRAQDAFERYRRADCDQQAKAVEVARVDLEFDREYLASLRRLEEAEVATRAQIIRAELEVRLDEQRLADATRRTAACREKLAPDE